MNFMECLLTETDEKERSYLFDAVILSQLLWSRIGDKCLSGDMETIRSIGKELTSNVYARLLTDADVGAINNAYMSCEVYSDELIDGVVTEVDLGLTFEEYLIFCRLVTNNPFGKMRDLAIQFKERESKKKEEASKMGLGALLV